MKRAPARTLAAALLAVALLAPVAGRAAAPAREGGDTLGAVLRVRVRMVDNRFRPRTLTIERGTRVKWVNRGSNHHTTTSEAWDSGILSPGESFARRFGRAGEFSYRCTIHSTMRGTILVS